VYACAGAAVLKWTETKAAHIAKICNRRIKAVDLRLRSGADIEVTPKATVPEENP
jgi:hypothetical protein